MLHAKEELIPRQKVNSSWPVINWDFSVCSDQQVHQVQFIKLPETVASDIARNPSNSYFINKCHPTRIYQLITHLSLDCLANRQNYDFYVIFQIFDRLQICARYRNSGFTVSVSRNKRTLPNFLRQSSFPPGLSGGICTNRSQFMPTYRD